MMIFIILFLFFKALKIIKSAAEKFRDWFYESEKNHLDVFAPTVWRSKKF